MVVWGYAFEVAMLRLFSCLVTKVNPDCLLTMIVYSDNPKATSNDLTPIDIVVSMIHTKKIIAIETQ